MTRFLHRSLLRSSLLAIIGLAATLSPVRAQFSLIHNFSGGSSDGMQPLGSLNGTGNGALLFGMTSDGGFYDYFGGPGYGGGYGGTVFTINYDGTGYSILNSFSTLEGFNPHGSLILSAGTLTLYGMTTYGGANDLGMIFKIKYDGSGYTYLHHFSLAGGSDGATPYGSLILSGTTLYGMTSGSANGNGVIFKMNTDGTGYAIVRAFAGGTADGANPKGSLTLANNTLYGMASAGGASGYGVVFKVNTDGTAHTILHSFAGGLDGKTPQDSLTLGGTTLYGMTKSGGSFGGGILFKINTNGSGYTNLHTFAASGDGGLPYGSLTLLGNTLLGMPSSGGGLFRINTDGTGYTILQNLSTTGSPYGSLALVGSTLCGMTTDGGTSDNGTVFSLVLPPPSITTASPLPAASVGAPYSTSLNATGGAPPYAWSITANGLPAGLSLSPTNGLISGTPTASGTTNFTVRCTANDGLYAQQVFTLTVTHVPPTITTSSPLPAGLAGVAYSAALAATGGATPYAWSITANGLPTGLSLNITNGLISGTPAASGTTNFTVRCTANDGLYAEQPFSLTINPPVAPTITTPSPLPPGTLGVPYTATLAATGGVTPYSWSVTANGFPAGLSLTSATGLISGTPTTSGATNFTVRCTGNNTLYTQQAFSLTINPPVTGRVLHTFTGGSDGANPITALVLSNKTLYGTTVGGGASGQGTVFRLNTDGTGFTNLYSFTATSDGANPYGGLVLSGNTLYGTASSSSPGFGTVFKVSRRLAERGQTADWNSSWAHGSRALAVLRWSWL